MATSQVTDALERFVSRALETRGDTAFESGFDAEWRSPCEIDEPATGGRTRWVPLRQTDPVDFRGLASAVEAPIHPDICAWYGSYWSGHFEAQSDEGRVSLIQLWNRDDFERLIENLVGHYMALRRARQPFTVFFANTDPDSHLFLSIHNTTGEVVLEEPGGKGPRKVVESDLATFLDRLAPLDVEPGIY